MDLVAVKKKTTFDKIRDYYLSGDDGVVLSNKTEEIRMRLEKAYNLLCNNASPQQVVNILMKDEGTTINQAQAYRDVRNAINLFGDVNKASKEGYRHILFEYAMKAYQLAVAAGNIAEMNRAVANMSKLKGLDKEDPDLPDFSRLQIAPTTVNVPKDVLDFVMASLGKGAVDISKFSPSIEDVDFEDLTDDEE